MFQKRTARCVAVALTFAFLMGAFVVLITPSARAALWTDSTDADFNANTAINGLEVSGIGAAAYVQIKKDLYGWSNKNPSSPPPARQSAGAAYDSRNGRTLIFGGLGATSNYLNDTWMYYAGNNTWKQIQAQAPPSARYFVTMAYDTARDIAVLFGGWNDDGQNYETWEYDAVTGAWTNRTKATKPALSSTPLTYDSGAGKVITAGYGATSWETWAYDTGTHDWTKRTGSNPPSDRAGHNIAYFPEISRTVIFGGGTMSGSFSETWEYSYSSDSWTDKTGSTGGRNPSARSSFGFAYRSGQHDLFLFGGQPGVPTDTWRYYSDAGNRFWAQISTSNFPPGRSELVLTNDVGANSTVLFGGRNLAGTKLSDTWMFEPGYRPGGYIQSRMFDSQHANTVWSKIFWNQSGASLPPGTSIMLKFATCNHPDLSDPFCWELKGPDGSPTSYYLSTGTSIWPGASPARYAVFYALLQCTGCTNGPHLEDVSVEYSAASIPPEVVRKGPASFGTKVTDFIWIEFSEPMDTGQVTVTVEPSLSLTKNWYELDSNLTLTHPATPFEYCTKYYVNITQAVDMESQSMVGLPYPWIFVTECPSPVIESTYPHLYDVEIPWTSPIYVNFSKPMNPSTVYVNLTPPLPDFTHVWTTNRNLKVTHVGNLADCTIYDVNVTGYDTNGMKLSPGLVPNPWQFTSYCQNPRVLAVAPNIGQLDVMLNTNVRITFSRAMNTGTVNVVFNPSITLTESWNSPQNTILTLSHPPPFLACTKYTANVTGEDPAGNSIHGGYFTWWFFTACGGSPYVVATVPLNGTANVPLDEDVRIFFNETMQPPTVFVTSFPDDWTWTAEWDPMVTFLTLNHTITSNFTACTTYYINVTGGKDQNQNKDLVLGPVPNHFVFSTVCTNPFVKSIVPQDGATDVLIDTNVTITFIKPMDTTTFTYNINPLMSLNEQWTNGDTVFHLDHGPLFTDGTLYRLNIIFAQDKAGNFITGDIEFIFTTRFPTPNPHIKFTDPADKDTGVPLDKVVYVVFNKTMSQASLQVILIPNPGWTFTPVWGALDMYLNLTHTTPFDAGTKYNITIIATDTFGNLLISGPVPNPWEFTTIIQNPHITSTSPADQQPNVPLLAPIVVNFDKAMNKGSVFAAILPGITYTSSWANGDMRLALYHNTTPFLQNQEYNVTITGDDTSSNPLMPGPVPNPWKFFTAIIPIKPGTPGGLKVERSGNDIVLKWRAATDAVGYHVYSSTDRFAPWPWALLDNTTATTSTATGHNATTTHNFYIVRAYNIVWAEGDNSTMGVKMYRQFTLNPSGSNAQWFSLPYNTIYKKASDIAKELGSGKINIVAKWDPVKQQSILYYFSHNVWRGKDFPITRGDGLWLGIVSSFSWVINGTDASFTLQFVKNSPPKGNYFFISPPYTNAYVNALSISNELTSSKILEIGRFNPSTNKFDRWYWTGTTWAGTNFNIMPGDGFYLIVASNFSWTPKLITPEVP